MQVKELVNFKTTTRDRPMKVNQNVKMIF